MLLRLLREHPFAAITFFRRTTSLALCVGTCFFVWHLHVLFASRNSDFAFDVALRKWLVVRVGLFVCHLPYAVRLHRAFAHACVRHNRAETVARLTWLYHSSVWGTNRTLGLLATLWAFLSLIGSYSDILRESAIAPMMWRAAVAQIAFVVCHAMAISWHIQTLMGPHILDAIGIHTARGISRDLISRHTTKHLYPVECDVDPDAPLFRSSSCSICLEAFEELVDVRLLGCGHYYHPRCIDDWLYQRNQCPMCTTPIETKSPRSRLGKKAD